MGPSFESQPIDQQLMIEVPIVQSTIVPEPSVERSRVRENDNSYFLIKERSFSLAEFRYSRSYYTKPIQLC